MDFGLREWLLIIGPVFIIGVLLHGYWRMRANRNRLKMSLDRSFMSSPGERLSEDEDLSMLRAELPNGGARVREVPEQTSFDLDEDVPVLMEPVEMGDDRERSPGEEEDTVAEPASTAESPVAPDKPEHFVVVYVTSVDGRFNGQSLLESLVELDMQFGDMNIFHRIDGAGKPLFSLVNAVEPGTFDIAKMDQLETPAVSLFMKAHDVAEPIRAFDEMIDVAQSLADELGGEVKDASRSVLTPQTIEHCREEIRDFQHRYPDTRAGH